MWRLCATLCAVTASDERGGQAAAEHFTVMGQTATEVSAFGVAGWHCHVLLTDIEGSTRLGENAPTAMPEAIARHYEISTR